MFRAVIIGTLRRRGVEISEFESRSPTFGVGPDDEAVRTAEGRLLMTKRAEQVQITDSM